MSMGSRHMCHKSRGKGTEMQTCNHPADVQMQLSYGKSDPHRNKYILVPLLVK